MAEGDDGGLAAGGRTEEEIYRILKPRQEGENSSQVAGEKANYG